MASVPLQGRHALPARPCKARWKRPSVEDVIARLQEQGHTPLEARRCRGLAVRCWAACAGKRGPFTATGCSSPISWHPAAARASRWIARCGSCWNCPRASARRSWSSACATACAAAVRCRAALDEEHGVFPKLYLSLVRAGEAGGSLEETLRRLADYLERAQQLRGSIDQRADLSGVPDGRRARFADAAAGLRGAAVRADLPGHAGADSADHAGAAGVRQLPARLVAGCCWPRWWWRVCMPARACAIRKFGARSMRDCCG